MTQIILGVHSGSHDAAAAVFEDYSLKAAVHLERLTRRKSDGSRHPDAAIDEVLSITGTTRRDVDVVAYSRSMFPTRYFRHLRGVEWLREQYRAHLRRRPRRQLMPELFRHETTDISTFLDFGSFQRDSGYRPDVITWFYNHHEAHALPALFYSPWENALIVTADGGGDNVHYSHRYLAAGRLIDIYGGEDMILTRPEEDSLGKMYGWATKALGFKRVRHEGKVTGLAAMGEPVRAGELMSRYRVDDRGRIHSDLGGDRAIFSFMRALRRGLTREDYAATVQKVLEDVMLVSIRQLLKNNPARNLGVSGGVFANVKLNRLLAEALDLDEVFVFPAMGDDGLPVGGALAWLLRRDGPAHWLKQRRDLGDLYLGRDFSGTVDAEFARSPDIRRLAEAPVEGTVRRLKDGEIGAIYTHRMEFGPRALGARTILANPARRETHDLLNTRLERSEFMPFAPVIQREKANQVFDITNANRRACRYMTIACDVRPHWRDRIPAVVHVDHSARPQIIDRADNPLYHDILGAFERETGLPVLVNTSFNVHEEPIVNTPAECLKALRDRRIDFVVTDQAIYARQAQ
ncbi:MAG TPA: carbamoyltransferase C-terminal domain-containing protein [Pseudolabrys sp.]|nr:carbamoyltransferase C-terminal domain-containing protein [Pseudolabrys sp.]